MSVDSGLAMDINPDRFIEAAPGTQNPPALTPPRGLVLFSDWCYFIAGIFLILAFSTGTFLYPYEVLGHDWIDVDNWFWMLEGVFYCIGSFAMVGVMTAQANIAGAFQFVIITFGGFFFSLSGSFLPACIVTVRHLVSSVECAGAPLYLNAVAHYGITCFMVGTAIGFKGILAAPVPRNEFFGPFWGVTMYFLGAWTIGLLHFYIPLFAGGWAAPDEADLKAHMLTYPENKWGVVTWWFGILGAIFLTLGAIIFLKMNGTINFK